MQVEAAPGGLGCHWGVGLGGWGVTGVSARLAGCDSDAQAQLEPQRVLFLEQITYANTQMEIKKKCTTFSIPLISCRVLEHPYPSLINKIIIATLVTFSFPKE